MVAALWLAACGGDDESSPGAPATGGAGGAAAGAGGAAGAAGAGGAGGKPPNDLPDLDELEPGWTALAPGGATTCARETPFQFFVRPGSVNRLLLEFRGGGACWSDATCSIGDSLFQETADVDPWVTDESVAFGVYDHEHPDNPFADWHHVYVPYCTGDVHWGDAAQTYGAAGSEYVIHHKGAVNVRAVLDWVYANVEAPEKVFVTGCSAGAYGSIMWSSHVREHYASAKVYQLADSGAGVITDDFFSQSFPKWNAEASYPTFIPGLDPDSFTRLAQLYTLIGGHFGDMLLSMYNTTYDENQAFYFSAMGGGDAQQWSTKMQENVAEIADTTPNFRYYQAPGYVHCILPMPTLYSVESGGVRLIDWIDDVVNDKPVDNVSCDPDCGGPKP
jgi:hypothetical protein